MQNQRKTPNPILFLTTLRLALELKWKTVLIFRTVKYALFNENQGRTVYYLG